MQTKQCPFVEKTSHMGLLQGVGSTPQLGGQSSFGAHPPPISGILNPILMIIISANAKIKLFLFILTSNFFLPIG